MVWSVALTAVSQHTTGDLQQDACIAADHDEQWKQEEAAEREHVVERLLPALPEAAMRRALREVLWGCDGHLMEEKRLGEEEIGERIVVGLVRRSWG